MSGLEPLAALGLACNILQLAELGKKTVDRIKVVYQSGTPDDELEQGAAVLEELAKEVKKHSQPGRKKYEEILLKSATACATAASDLGEEVRFMFENAKKGSLVSALKVTTRVAWRQRRLERLRRILDAEEQRMQTSLLAQVWSSTNAAGTELRGVRRQLRYFIEQYRQGRRETAELVSVEVLNTRKHVSVEAERTKEAVGLVGKNVDLLTAMKGEQIGERVRERFLESLKNPGFNQRRNQIDAAYGDTLELIFFGDNDEEWNDDPYGEYDFNSNESGDVHEEWQSDLGHHSDHNNDVDEQHDSRDVFNTGASGAAGETSWSRVSEPEAFDSEEEEHRDHEVPWEIKWDSFSNWLSSTGAIYWISGKPGSGKTTVVKYILADERTKKYLHIWGPGCAIVSHYFWLPGSPMQRNMEGLLCSLLYQLLENNLNAFMEVMSSVSDPKSSYTDWSSAELHSAVVRALDWYKSGICLFLDGIDEIKPDDGTKDGIPELLDWAIGLSQRSKIKLVLASRPDPHILETRLSKYPRLRLQDLNYQDLVTYAEGRVKIPEHVSAQNAGLIQSLANKAEGVFLWLILAIKSVNEGFRDEDSVDILQKRIDRLPQGLDSLYKDMWARAGAHNPLEYRQTAALYFKLLLASKVLFTINLFDVTLATTSLADRVLHAMNDRSKLVREDDMLQQCKEVEKKLNIYCVGLIQMRDGYPVESAVGCSWYGHVYDRIFPVTTKPGLEFIHRTASDFLTDTKSGREILDFDNSSDLSIQCRLLHARLASLALFAQSDTNAGNWAAYLAEIHRSWGRIDRDLPQNWNRLVSVCEQLADSGRLLAVAGDDDFKYLCSGIRFLDVITHISPRRVVDELLISRVKSRSLSESEKSSFLMASITLISFYNTQSLFRTCREMLRAGADPNWQGWLEWGGIPNNETGAYGILQTPWQQLLVFSVERLLSGTLTNPPARTTTPTRLTSLAAVFLLFVSKGAKLSDSVNLELRFQRDTHEWNLRSLRSVGDAGDSTILTSIPAYMIIKLLTTTLRGSCSTLDRESFPKVCADLESACESYRSSGTCRVFGTLETEWSNVEWPKKHYTWWETTNEVQVHLGSILVEWLERQLLLSTPVIEGADVSESSILDVEQTFRCIWDHESWTVHTSEPGMSSICERFIELGIMTSLDGVVEFHSTEKWVRKHNLENPQYGGTT